MISSFDESVVKVNYPIEDGGPALHRNALEDGEHCEADVIEGGDPPVRPLPLLQTRTGRAVAYVGPEWRHRLVVCVARRWTITFIYCFTCTHKT